MTTAKNKLSKTRGGVDLFCAQELKKLRRKSRRRFAVKLACLLFFAIAVCALVVLRRDFSAAQATIDARLKNGYLTSQPGIYAAPQTLRVGRALDADALANLLERAGYVEGDASDVWSGGFQKIDARTIRIAPARFDRNNVNRAEIVFGANNRIARITGDNRTLDSFALEPEFIAAPSNVKTSERAILRFEDLPENLVNAIVAVEDRSFFEHRGFDLNGIARAVWTNFWSGKNVSGGSTITQQLIKNTYLTADRTFARKYRELLFAVALERRLTKPEIFAVYCNEIYLGQRGDAAVRGMRQAAAQYFGKSLQELTLAESALLAGMIKSPARFSPAENSNKAVERRNSALNQMVDAGKIGRDEADIAAREAIWLAPVRQTESAIAPHYLDYVRRAIAAQESQNSVVRTTIDLELQRDAQAIVNAHLQKLAAKFANKKSEPQAALVALDPHTGDVLALVGGGDYAKSQLNRAIDARRQPGSTFKPFVYAAALEEGVSPLARVMDAPREFRLAGNAKYSPANFGNRYSNQMVTLRTALVNSLNTATVELALETGVARVANLAAEFGLPKTDKYYPSLALGTLEAAPLEIAAAYAAFANGGVKIAPRVIAAPPASDESANVQTVEEKRLIKPETAFMITDILADVIENGTARSAKAAFKNVAVAGKTGTTDKDNWFVGYTPNLVVAVWVGFDDGAKLNSTGAETALPIWTEFVSKTVDARPEFGGAAFAVPAGITFAEIDRATGKIANENCPTRARVAISQTFAPLAECFEHKSKPEDSGEILVAENAATASTRANAAIDSTIENAARQNFAVAAFVAERPQPETPQTADLQRQMNRIELDAERAGTRRRRDTQR